MSAASRRHLPAPTARSAFAAIETIDDFAPRWSEWAARLGIKDLTTITVLGDGAEWIWNAATRQFGQCHQILDIYHAAEHIAIAARGRFGEGTPEAAAWLERGRDLLLSDGWAGLCDHLGRTLTTDNGSHGRAAPDELISYFAAHTEPSTTAIGYTPDSQSAVGWWRVRRKIRSATDSSKPAPAGSRKMSTEWPNFVVSRIAANGTFIGRPPTNRQNPLAHPLVNN